MDFDSISAIVFVILLTFFLIRKRGSIVVEKILFPVVYLCLYRTRLGLRFMERFAKRFSKPLCYISFFAVFAGFAGMLLIAYTLIANWVRLLTVPKAVATVALVLPFKVKGAFFVPFFYWIVSIFIIAVVHEFSHGIIARVFGIRIKSSGFAFLGIFLPLIPAAFVEPDEDELKRLSGRKQLSVFAAGPFSNIALGLLCFGLLYLLLPPLSAAMIEQNGVLVTGIVNTSLPAGLAGIKQGEIITMIDSTKIVSLDNFSSVLAEKKPGSTVVVLTNASPYNVTLAANPNSPNSSYMGVLVQQSSKIKGSFIASYGSLLPSFILWVIGLVIWLYVLSLGIGLFNLVPLGPIDGGRMLKTALLRFFNERRALSIWRFISGFFLFLILANIISSFLR